MYTVHVYMYVFCIHLEQTMASEGEIEAAPVQEPEDTQPEPEDTKPEPEDTKPEAKESEEPSAAAKSPEDASQEETVKSKPVRVKVWSIDPADGPDIAMEQSGISAEEPITIGQMMKNTVSKVPDRVGLRYKTGETWNDITYQQYYDQCIAVAKSFLKVHVHVYVYTCIYMYMYMYMHLPQYIFL